MSDDSIESLNQDQKGMILALIYLMLLAITFTFGYKLGSISNKQESKQICIPCSYFDGMGFKYTSKDKEDLTHCIPCANAKTKEQKFICFGEQ